jgi:uncharacterized protein with gpF-like domain
MTTKKPKTLNPIRPSAAVEAKYAAELKRHVRKMSTSFERWILEAMRKKATAEMLDDLMQGLANKWQSDFDGISEALAYKFAKGAGHHTDAALRRELKKAGFAIEFDITENEKQAYAAVIAENINLIKSIPQQYHAQVQTHAWNAVTTGGDLHMLKNNMTKQFGITDRRAAFIALDQSSKANTIMENARRIDLGLNEAIWLHSRGGKEPRPSHVKASEEKLRYDIRKGALIDGEYIHPGMLINCRCVSITVVPGFND